MNPKNLNKIFVEAGIIAALSLTFAGCGQQDQKQGKNVAAEKSTDLKKDQNDKSGKASLGLALPKNLPAEVDQVEVSLSRMIAFDDGCGGVISVLHSKSHQLGRPCMVPAGVTGSAVGVGSGDIDKKSIAASTHQIFAVNGQPIQINDLDAGDYWITVNLVNSATGRVYSTGEGRATVEAGKLATARISMTKVEDTTGGLIIVLEDVVDSNEPAPIVEPVPAPPLMCPAIFKNPVCVVVGKSLVYQVHEFQGLPNSCNWAPLPQFFQQVPNSHCLGLPGSERLWTGGGRGL
ncbi:MAG: hypothetical protein NTY08_15245 [Proteobacteria bacterium]|nr:hypothetical protein [Pseudomonadota bacterium]